MAPGEQAGSSSLRHRAAPNASTSATTTTSSTSGSSLSTTSSKSRPTGTSSAPTTYYRLRLGTFPTELHNKDISREEWRQLAERIEVKDKDGTAAAGDLHVEQMQKKSTTAPVVPDLDKIEPMDPLMHTERIIGITLYLSLNVTPGLLPLFLLSRFLVLPFCGLSDLVYESAGYYLNIAILLTILFPAFLFSLEFFILQPLLRKRYPKLIYAYDLMFNQTKGDDNFFKNQYLFSEWLSMKYLSLQLIWPTEVDEILDKYENGIFVMIPHGPAPLAQTCYSMWSKLFGTAETKPCALTRWTCAPVLFKLPFVSALLRSLGYIPANGKKIEKYLELKQSIGIVLDGIKGMFYQSKKRETACIADRKGIVKIALKTGKPLIPVYAFGQSELYSVLQDPFGILATVSTKLNVSILPFFGRFGMPYGPPYRKPVAVVFGKPIDCFVEGSGSGSGVTSAITNDQVDLYHGKLCEEFENIFETHKHAYGWGHKELRIVA
ncbi:unnamed protein product [Amoebophrya sp. A120]|nr:unnamed protein product [Amoebophrya sp. A120]|eukprot:GSA120T00008799001.1